VTLITTAFETLARYQARAMGYPNLRMVVITHPLGGISPDQILAKAKGAAGAVADLFPGQPAVATGVGS
jgi:hypothetical protein